MTSSFMPQPTGPSPVRFAANGPISLAYQVLGDGPTTVLVSTGWVLPMESIWDDPAYARFIERLAADARVVLWDKRGTGMSDRVSVEALPTLEQRMDDLGAVLDAVGVEEATVLGLSEGAVLAALFAAAHPERTAAVVLYGGWPCTVGGQGYAWMPDRADFDAFAARIQASWDDMGDFLALWAPSRQRDPAMRAWWTRALHRGASPASAVAWLRMLGDFDIREAVPRIRAPTLVLHRAGDRIIAPENGRWLAENVPGARYVELDGDDHLWWVGDQDALLREIEDFLGRPAGERGDRRLVTVMFTDIVGSTSLASRLGDRTWRDVLGRHDEAIRAALRRFGGVEVKTLGDGVLAAFDSPASALRCAGALHDAADGLGLELRVGLHVGEVVVSGGDLHGMAVVIAARVVAAAAGGETLVSRTVRDLVTGSGVDFEARGARELKGVDGEWELFAVAPPA